MLASVLYLSFSVSSLCCSLSRSFAHYFSTGGCNSSSASPHDYFITPGLFPLHLRSPSHSPVPSLRVFLLSTFFMSSSACAIFWFLRNCVRLVGFPTLPCSPRTAGETTDGGGKPNFRSLVGSSR